MRTNLMATTAALLSLLATWIPAETVSLGSVQGDGAIGTAGNSTGNFNLTTTAPIQRIVTSMAVSSSFPAEARIRLVAPGGTPVIDMQLSPTGVAGGTQVFSGAGIANPAALNGTWTYECFDSFPDAGIDWTGTGLTISLEPALAPSALGPETFATYTAASGSFQGVFAATSAANGPMGWLEAQGALGNPVSFGATPPLSNGARAAWSQDGFANAGIAGAVSLNIFGTGCDEWLITPMVDLGAGGTDYNLSFDMALTTFGGTAATTLGPDDSFVVLISDDGGSVWRNTGGQVLRTYTSADTISNTGQAVTIPVTGFTGLRRFAFVGFSSTVNADNDLFIDNVRLEVAATNSVDVSQADPDSSVQRGDSVFYSVNVTNTGSAADNFAISVTGNSFTTTLFEADQTTPLGSPINLGAGLTHPIEVRVDVPAGATVGLADTATVTALGLSTDSEALTTTAAEFNFGGGGVAEGGYFFANSLASGLAPSRPVFAWVDISGTGTDIIGTLDDDDFDGPFTIGFPFSYMGTAVSEFYVHDNGFVTFGSTPPTTGLNTNGSIPNVNPPNNAADWFWDDLNADDVDVANKHVYVGAAGGNRVITWERYPRFVFGTDPDAWITAQMILKPNGNILIQYSAAGSTMPTGGATVGIENASGTAGIEYHRDGTKGPVAFPLAVEFGLDNTQLTGVSGIGDWMLR